MRRIKQFLAGFTVVAAVGILVLTFWLRDRYVVPILTYHNISETKDQYSLNNVRPRSFARQMKFLKRHGYNVISFDDWVDGTKRGRAFSHNTVILHFDDGYADNYTNALPILKMYGYPAMVFLVSDKIGTQDFLTWGQVREMDAQGFKAGAHTRRHVYLPDVSPDAAQDEIAGSKKIIEEHLGHAIDYFVYPSGGFTDEAKGMVQQAGFKAAGTTNRGQDRFNRDLFEVKRIRVKDSDGAIALWAKLSGYYNLLRKSKCGSAGHCFNIE